MERIEVHKFGGTSLASAERLTAAATLVGGARRGARIVVVASAMGGVTDLLVRAADAAVLRDEAEVAESLALLRSRHRLAAQELADAPGSADVAAELESLLDDLERRLDAVAGLGELTPRTRAALLATGEKLSVRLLALALRGFDLPAVAVDADGFLETTADAASAAPLHGVTPLAIQAALAPRLERGELPVVTGFCGRAPDGSTTLLGRGGSDWTATLVAAALPADAVTIWTDVDGVFSADPRTVPGARVLSQLNYREAAELSYYGAKVLHQRTILPVAELDVPVHIRNTFRPEASGTVVDGRFTPGSHPVKAISAIRGQALVSVEGKGMAGVPGVAARLFDALAERGISVTMISQSSSESSICIAVPESDAIEAEMALKRAFRVDVSHGDVDDVLVRRRIGLLAAVGLGMAHVPGVAKRVFSALGERGVNVLAVAQGSSELNLSIAVDGDDVDESIRALHDDCDLARIDTGEEAPDGLELLLVGCGQVGRALCDLVLERHSHVFERHGLTPHVVAIADRSGYLFDPRGIDRGRLAIALEAKAAGSQLAKIGGATAPATPLDMVRDALRYRLRRPVLVDVSNDGGSGETFRAALELGCDVVTANKEPLAGSFEEFEALRRTAAEHGRLMRAEATVGAGLPIVDTLDQLLATGDRLRSVEGVLSGTLAFLVSRVEEGVLLSDAVTEAIEQGFTEPDPALDLCGLDVERKAIILARTAGLAVGPLTVKREGLVADSLRGLPVSELLDHLRREVDGPLARRLDAARERDQVLRYLARVGDGEIGVGPVAVPADSPLGMLRGPDNMVVFHTDRYADRPLVVSGPGAGVPVTAMGVLADVLRIAAERKRG